MAIILASASPRRKELLSFITENFEIKVSDAEEKADYSLTPSELVISISKQKADAVLPKVSKGDVLISADTVVNINGKILGKPHSRQEAFDMLSELSGNIHRVYTGVSITDGEKYVSFAEETEVEFFPLSPDEINEYIDSKEPFDKAGAYGIQGKGALLVKGIKGDFYNVMGFPVARVSRELKKFGL